MPMEHEMTQLMRRVESAVLGGFGVLRKTNGVCPFQFEKASTSTASTASERTRTPFDSRR